MAHQVLEGFYLNGGIIYIDDTVIYERFFGNVDMVLARMAQFNVRLKPSKCFLACDQ